MKLMVLDGNSIVNRAFYGVRTMLSTSAGVYTNAVFGFLNILQKLLDEDRPDALCVAFDLRAPTFRHKQFEAYKAQRKPMPEELASQMPLVKEALAAMNIPYYQLEGFEADDLIGTISAKCEAAGWDCIVVTGDRDSLQLVTGRTHVRLISTRMGQTESKLMTPEAFFEEYGFEPKRIIDLKALMGDSSDNIPGVPGVGEKTALDLVRRFGSLDGVYSLAQSPEIKEGVRKKLAAGEESARLSFDLATIRRDAPFDFSPEANLRRDIDAPALYALFKRLEFNRLIEKYGLTPAPEEAREQTVQGECVSLDVCCADDAEKMLETLEKLDCVNVRWSDGFDIVTAEHDCSAYILRRSRYAGDYLEALRGLFSSRVKKAGHDVKSAMHRLLDAGLPAEGWVSDVALAAYLLEPTATDYSLGRLTERFCGFEICSCAEANEQLSLLPDEIQLLARLLSEAAAIGALREALEPRVKDGGMDMLYREIELPLCQVLSEMERDGFLIDKNALVEYGRSLAASIELVQREIYDMAGGEFNINSPKQLGEVLFTKLMLPPPKKTKTGYSTNIDVLEKLLGKHPIIERIISYRKLTKLKSTYADGLLKVISPDGRIRTSFQMTVTATGRLSSTEPNLQNIPVRTALGGEIRKMFIAPEGMLLVDADYSQIELRILAHISGDETMKKAFTDGEDIHRVTASQVFGVSPEAVTSLQRSRAKAVNFGIVYGISAFSLAQDIGVYPSEAKTYIENYLAKYSGVSRYMKDIVASAKRDGYVTTLFGRRRALPELQSSNFSMRSFGERVALNTPIQGTAADVIKLAMVRVWRRLRAEGLRARLILQIHDELIVESPEDEVERVKAVLAQEMEAAAHFSVPLVAEAHVGKNWLDAK